MAKYLFGRKSLLLVLLSLFLFSYSKAQDSIKITTPGGHLDSVWDNQGNRYSLAQIALDDTFRAQAYGGIVQPLIQYSCSSGYFQLWLEDNSGVEDYLTDIQHQARLDVLCQVLHDISNMINSPLTSTGQKVNIWVRDINNVTTMSGVLGLATSFYNVPSNPTISGIVDNTSWITILSGKDAYINVSSPLNTLGGPYASFGTYFHGMMAFDFSGAVNWHTTMSSTTASGHFDLYTVVLHEMLHALGFASLINDNGLSKLGTDHTYFTRYDQQLSYDVGMSATPLITNTGSCAMYQWTWNNALPLSILSPDPSTCTTDYTECSTAVKYFGGLTTAQMVYTPNCFEPPSSLAHFEDECQVATGFTPLPPLSDNRYFVMSNAQDQGPLFMKRHPVPEEWQVLCDIGYNLNTTYGNNTTAVGSYINYGGSACPGVQVAGINDGIDGGIYVFTYAGSAITINDASGPYKFMGNDVGANGFECIEDITDNTPGTFTIAGFGINDVVTYDPPVGEYGVRLLRYTPINTTTGERGNITYIYVYVPYPNCSSDACNMVSNGDFESSDGYMWWHYDNTPALVPCWEHMSGSPDLFKRDAPSSIFTIPCPWSSPASEVHQNSNIPNDYFIGIGGEIWFGTKNTESIQTMMTTPFSSGTYTVRFWAKRANNTAAAGPWDAHLLVCGSPTTLAPMTSMLTGVPVGITQLSPNFITIPPDNQWHYIVETFPYTGTPLNNLIIMNCGWVLDETALPDPAHAYVYLDDITVEVNAATFTPTAAMTTCDPPLDLSLFVSVPGGTFDGYGVTGNFFNPLAGLIASLADNNGNSIAIKYTYLDGSGCEKILWAEIEVDGGTGLTVTAPSIACFGSTVVLNVAGGTWANGYNWVPGVTCLNPPCSTAAYSITTPTNFVVTNTDNLGCTTVASHFVNIPPSTLHAGTTGPNVICNPTSLDLWAFGGTGYNWAPSGGLVCPTCPSTTGTAPPGQTTYTVTATDQNGCPQSETVTVFTPMETACDPCGAYPGEDFWTIGDEFGNVNGVSYGGGNYFVYQDLYISGISLWEESVVLLAPGVKIHVLPGAFLSLRHCHLFSCQMWDGIILESDGVLADGRVKIYDRSFIEDAVTAVKLTAHLTPYPANSQKWVEFENSIFNKNTTTLQIENVQNAGTSVLPYEIWGNVFTSRNFNTLGSGYPFTWPNVFTGPGAPRAYWNSGSQYLPDVQIDDPSLSYTPIPCNDGNPALYGIFTRDVGGVHNNEFIIGQLPPVWNSDFYNQTLNVFDHLKYGVHSEKTNLTFLNNMFMHMQGTVMSFGPVDGVGIWALAFTSNPYNNWLRIHNPANNFATNKFYGNVTAVETRNYYQVIGRDARIVSDHNALAPNTGVFGYLCRSAKYNNNDISNNEIVNIENGIVFEALTNGVTQNAGLMDIRDNILSAAYGAPTTQYMTNGIWVQNLVSCFTCGYPITAFQTMNIWNNTISNTKRGIFANNFQNQPVLTLNNLITLEDFAPQSQFGINHTRCYKSRIIQNEVAGAGFTLNPGLNRGIQVVRCDLPIVNCNLTYNTNIGIEFNSNNPGTRWRFNEMMNNNTGMYLNLAGVIGTQGGPTDPIHNVWTDDGLGFTWTGANVHTFTDNGSASATSQLYVLPGAPEEPLNNFGIPGFTAYALGATYHIAAGSNPSTCTPFNYIELEQLVGGGEDEDPGEYLMAARDEITFEAEQERVIWGNQLQTYRSIQSDSTLIDTSIVLQEFKSVAQDTRFDYLTSIESELAKGEFANAEGMIADDLASTAAGVVTGDNDVVVVDIPEADNIVENYKSFYSIYSRFMADSLWATDTSDVYNLASGCPITDGDVVYQARALYNSITHAMIVFQDSCVLDTTTTGSSYRQAINNSNGKPKSLTVNEGNKQSYQASPNPVRDGNFNIAQKITDEKPVRMKMYNSASQEVFSKELKFIGKKAEVHCRNLSPGLYLILLTDSAGKSYSIKLNVL